MMNTLNMNCFQASTSLAKNDYITISPTCNPEVNLNTVCAELIINTETARITGGNPGHISYSFSVIYKGGYIFTINGIIQITCSDKV